MLFLTASVCHRQVLRPRGSYAPNTLAEAEAELRGRIEGAATNAIGQGGRAVVSALLANAHDLGAALKGEAPVKQTVCNNVQQAEAASSSR